MGANVRNRRPSARGSPSSDPDAPTARGCPGPPRPPRGTRPPRRRHPCPRSAAGRRGWCARGRCPGPPRPSPRGIPPPPRRAQVGDSRTAEVDRGQVGALAGELHHALVGDARVVTEVDRGQVAAVTAPTARWKARTALVNASGSFAGADASRRASTAHRLISRYAATTSSPVRSNDQLASCPFFATLTKGACCPPPESVRT